MLLQQKPPYHPYQFQSFPVFLNGSKYGFMRRFALFTPHFFLFKGRLEPFQKPHFQPCQIPFQIRVALFQFYPVKRFPRIYQVVDVESPFWNGLNAFPSNAVLFSGSEMASTSSCFSGSTCFSTMSGKVCLFGKSLTNCSKSLRAM